MKNRRHSTFGKPWLLGVAIAALAFEFFGCGAADIQSAKAYRQQRDYVRADGMLEKALKEDPANDEAWYLYVENLYDLSEYEKIGTVMDSALLHSVTHHDELLNIQRNAWVQLYNGAVSAYNANPDSKETQQAAIGYLKAGQELAPEQPETYDMLATIYFATGDTAHAVETYRRELAAVGNSNAQGVAMGLMLDMTPDAVSRALGAPTQQRVVSIGGSDSATIYVYSPKNAYVYFERSRKGPHAWALTGWRITTSEQQGMQPLRVSEDAYTLVANDYYQRGLRAIAAQNIPAAVVQFDSAIPLLMTLQKFDPSNEFAAQAIPDMYLKTNRTDAARQEYQSALQAHPSKAGYVQYGMLLMKANDFEGAAAQFEKSLSLDPNYAAGLYDLGATYKNWARDLQETKGKEAEARAKLEQSTTYFERLYTTEKTDFTAAMQLADNYVLLNKKDKAVAMLGSMENLKSNGDAAQDPMYWETLGRLYAMAGRGADSEAAFKHADQLRNH